MNKNIVFDNPFGSCDCDGLCSHTLFSSYLEPYQKLLEALEPKKVFEWGTGENTKLALKTGARVISVEHSKDVLLDPEPNLVQILVDVDDDIYPTLHGYDDCDIYFVDARRRLECIQYVREHATKSDHLVYLHDAQRQRYHSALKLYNYVRFVAQGNAVACNRSWIIDL